MKLGYSLLSGICLFMLLNSYQTVAANNSVYEQRRQDYIDSSLASSGGAKMILQAYRGIPVDAPTLTTTLANIATGTTSDFDIIEMIRILYLDSGTYDAQILPVLNSVPYWINSGDTVRNYWSENHMIMWMGSDWLLHERNGKAVDSNLRKRLVHFLNLKNQYGFYEFFSSVYSPYCLSGMLNLADFAQDAEIKSLAISASQRLLETMLMMTTDKGTYYPVAGRNYSGKYSDPYGASHNNLIYLITGFGDAPVGASHGGTFMATSSLEVDTVISSWTPNLDTLLHIGHSLDSGFVLNSGMSSVDKVVFQWSSGAYFHPDVVQETVQLLQDSNLWHQVDFSLLLPLASIVTPQTAPGFANNLSSISKSSVICKEDVAIFKHKSITLSSVIDFWKGKVGFQQYPCVANVGTTAVYTSSGEVNADWDARNSNNANIHLPYVMQKKNVSLLMYRPEPVSPLVGTAFTYKDVSLRWNDAAFDEVRNDSMWLLGRQGSNYVAVRRSCTGEINTVRACETNGGQTWVLMVGDSVMYGSFNNFQAVIDQSHFEERWYLDTTSSPAQYVYYSKIVMDTTTIEYAWGVDTVLATGISSVNAANNTFSVYPNPANDRMTLDLSSFANQSVNIKVMNMVGQELYQEKVNVTTNTKTIPTQDWAEGVYMVVVETAQGKAMQKLIKQN